MAAHIKVINSMAELNALPASPPVLIDFHASWCGPCHAIAPVFNRLAAMYGSSDRLQFASVDVDAAKDVAGVFQISAMPTFVVRKGQQKVEEMKGANPAGLEALAKKYALEAGASAGPAEKGLEGFSSLNGSIDMAQVHCLNEDSSHTIRDLLKGGGGDKWLESDADEQLLLHIPMQQSTKLRALKFTTAASQLAKAPKTIRLFVNQSSIGFDDAESLEPAQEIVLTEEQAKGAEPVQLRFVRFQAVNTLSIFVADNHGDEDTTRIDSFSILGLEVAGTDMAALRKGEDDHDH